MFECPSCQQALPPNARFCTHCGVCLSVTIPVSVTTEPYAYEKCQLAAHSLSIMNGMESLLPFVYENRRAENQALFASTLAQPCSLEDPVWGRVAFVLGAYGNYMHRYPLTLEQKQQVWQALLWAVYYERCFRRKYLTQRFQQLLHFLHGCVEDAIFLKGALDDLEALRPYLEVSSLKKAVESLKRLPEPPVALLQCLNEQLETMQGTEAALDVRLHPLPETESRQSLLLEADDPNSNFLQGSRTQREESASNQNKVHKHFKQEMDGYASSYSHYEKYAHIDVPSDYSAQYTWYSEKNLHNNSVHEPSIWRDSAQSNLTFPIYVNDRKDLEYGTSHILRLFLDEEQCQAFHKHLHATHLEAVSKILREAQHALFTALRRVVEIDLSVCQEPRRPIRLGRKHTDRFEEARYLLRSPRADEQQRGLRLFEQGARETTHPDYSSLAREWMFYARALVQGCSRVIDDWENARQSNEASWEELWNLAAFYQRTGYPAECLNILQPEIATWRAPLAHLRLALTAALDLVCELPDDQSSNVAMHRGKSEENAQVGRAFLLAHLEHWPHPLCALARLVLAEETHGPLHPRQQSQRLSAFQALTELAQPCPDPRLELTAAQIAELEDGLARRARCEEAWFFWINDYAERHLRTYAAWTQLADVCERLGRLERAAEALQHLVEIQYHHDYAHYQEGTPLPRARFLRRNLEKLFEFYQRHRLFEQGGEAFTSCYPVLSHLWDAHDPENRKLLTLTQPYLEAHRRAEARIAQSRRELSVHEISLTRTVPLELGTSRQRVGIFIDYENIARFIPHDTEIEEVGRVLLAYAASFGEVVCQWASASPQNLSNLADVRGGLEAVGFRVRLPRRELQFSPSKKNLADFALLECLSEAAANERPDIYLIVSGDRDYYERICSLLDAGHIVHLLASTESQHLSLRYRELAQQRARLCQQTGSSTLDFFIDDLEALLCPLATRG